MGLGFRLSSVDVLRIQCFRPESIGVWWFRVYAQLRAESLCLFVR